MFCVCAVVICYLSSSCAGSRKAGRSPTGPGSLERQVPEAVRVRLGRFALRLTLGLGLLRPVGSDGAVFGAVALAGFLYRDHRVKPLAHEVVGVELLVRREAGV